MNSKRKISILIIAVAIIICLSIMNIYLNNNEVLENIKVNRFANDKMISIMLETSRGSGEYATSSSNAWPDSGYLFNEKLSSCENGSTLIWNEESRSISLKANISDRCYVYFDIEPPDIYFSASNIPTTVGALANLSCDSGTTLWNEKYQRIEVSSLNAKYTTCNLSFTERPNKTYLNNYITSLSGTPQGTGELVNEIAKIPDYTNASSIDQNQYKGVSTYYTTSLASTSGTTISNVFSFDGTNWSTNASAMTSGTYYHFQFTIEDEGYYQFCYTMSSGSTNNRLYLYSNNTSKKIGGSGYINASSTEEKNGCDPIGYVSSGTIIRVIQRAYTTIGTISFTLQKTSTINTYDAGYRYEGQNPNNYVWFNNELWRIIGVFDSTSHGVTGKNLVKIIRANPIGGLVWDKSNTNDWSTASLMNLLNGAYLNQEDATNGDYCYGHYSTTTAKAKCDYTNIGIDNTYRKMISSTTWYLGGGSTDAITTGTMYEYERGTTVYSGRPTSLENTKIGLMYASDYGYAALASSCARTTNLDSYNNANCTLNNWLYGNGYENTITPSSSSSNLVFSVYQMGDVTTASNRNGYAVRPVLYLESEVYIIDGDGSEANPYIIGI